MLKALVILIAIVIAVVNVSAQSSGVRRRVVKVGVVRVGPSTTYLKQGLSTEEVVRLLGEPTTISEDEETNGAVTYEFPRGEGRVLIAEFVKNSLVSSRTEMRTNAQVGR